MSALKTLLLVSTMAWAAACGAGANSDADIARTSGTIGGKLIVTGDWPQAGAIVVVPFTVAPWKAEYVPGAPTGLAFIEKPTGGFPATSTNPVEIEYEIPNMPFKTYDVVTCAWQDPDDDNSATRYHPLGVAGVSLQELMLAGMQHKTLEVLNSADPVTLSSGKPDVEVAPIEIMLVASPDDMRSTYPPPPQAE